MQDRPTSIELLEAAADFVDREIVPAIEGARQFQARVVANVMRIVAREIQNEDPGVRVEEVADVNHYTLVMGRSPGPHRVVAAIEACCGISRSPGTDGEHSN